MELRHFYTSVSFKAGALVLIIIVCSHDRETCLLHTGGIPPIHFKLVTRQQLSTGNNFWSLPTQAA